MATYNSAGSGNFNVDATWTESGHPSTGDTAIINTGHTVTMTADDAVGSIDIKGTLTTDGTARTLTLDANAQGYICEHRGTVSTTINLVINSDFAGDKLIRLNNGGNGNFNDVSITLQSTSRKLTIGTEAASIDGDLTITQGIFDTDSSNNYALTVTGATDVTGTLTLNDSTVSLGALRANSGAAITQGSSGTLEITTGSTFGGSSSYSFRNLDGTSDINLGGTLTVSGGTYFEPKTAPDNASVLNHVVGNAAAYWVGKVTIGGNYTLNAGNKWQTYGGSKDFVVTGDVTLNGHLSATSGTLAAGSTGEMKFGSLTINSGGTYTATPLTTTITTATGAGSSSNRAAFCHASGTFTHNNGLFKTTAGNADVEFTSQSETNNPFYDFEATQYAIAATSPWVVLNNMTIANGFQFNGSSGYAKVLGIMKQTGGTYNASDVSSSTNHFFNHYKLEGGTLDLSNIDITVGSIRNTGGTIS